MSELSPLEQEVARLIVETLNLEDVVPEGITPDAPLFNAGLGLDSIDALELSLGISMKYGLQIKSGDGDNARIFSSLRSLSQHIENHRKK